MRKYIILVIFLGLLIFLALGCPREPGEEKIEEASIEVGPVFFSEIDSEPQAKLPPSGPYKPTNRQIQTALENAGYYEGKIDGAIGLLTKKAIRDFQAANNLKVDGKIGPKTWRILSRYLSPPPQSQ